MHDMLFTSYFLQRGDYSMFSSYLGIIESIASLGNNATITAIHQMNTHLSRHQVARVLKSLEGEKYVSFDMVKHGGSGKKVYYLLNVCVTNIFITNKRIDESGYLNAEGI